MLSKRAVMLAVILATAVAQGQMSIRTVALSGDQCPGAQSGTTFGNLFDTGQLFQPGPAINNAGQVAFLNEGSCKKAIFSEGRGSLTRVARLYQAIDGLSSITSLNSGPRLSDSGDVFFQSIDNNSQHVIVSDRGGILHFMIRCGPGGTPLPGTPPASYLRFFGNSDVSQSPNVSRNGHLTFHGMMNDFNIGLWGGPEGGLALHSYSGMQVPGGAPGQYFNIPREHTFAHSVNNLGQVAFEDDWGIYITTPGSAQLVMAANSDLPGFPGHGLYNFQNPQLNDSGDLMMIGTASSIGDSILAYNSRSGVIRNVAVTGVTPAPGQPPGVTVSPFEKEAAMNGRGQVAFRGQLSGPGITSANRDGFWAEDLQGFLKLLVQTGMQAPGFEPGVRFSELGLGSVISINANGYAVMGADILQNGWYRPGYWAGNPDTGELFPMLMRGQTIEVRPGDVRTIDSALFANSVGWAAFSSGSQDGLPSGLNDNNQAAFRVSFTDGSSGIFVVTFPEPETAWLIAIGVIAAARRRMRSHSRRQPQKK
ncbi:MAG: hypothetical protein HZA51_03860 [Planctomycetes bacterium]|nr:hypothetical protein [Planctomycetota bacterium]